jgi:hypothetical protein
MTRMTMAARPMVEATVGGSGLCEGRGERLKGSIDNLHMLTMLPFRLLP